MLRTRGLSTAALQHVFRSTAVARLMYAASSWRGLTKASDHQRINSVNDQARRHGYCSPDLPTFDDLCDTADDELFAKAARLLNHVLHALLPSPSTASQRYDLRQRIHSLQLPSDCNFSCACYIKTNTRTTQFYSYSCLLTLYLCICIFFILCIWPAFCHAIIKRILIE